MMLDANSSTPVRAANKAVGPSTVRSCKTCLATLASIMGAPKANHKALLISSTAGATSARLPTIAATCERTRCVTSSTKPSMAPGAPSSLSLAAMAGAVMAGCLVATVKCNIWISTKLRA